MSEKDTCPVCNSLVEYKYTGPSKRNGDLDWYKCTNENCMTMIGKKGQNND